MGGLRLGICKFIAWHNHHFCSPLAEAWYCCYSWGIVYMYVHGLGYMVCHLLSTLTNQNHVTQMTFLTWQRVMLITHTDKVKVTVGITLLTFRQQVSSNYAPNQQIDDGLYLVLILKSRVKVTGTFIANKLFLFVINFLFSDPFFLQEHKSISSVLIWSTIHLIPKYTILVSHPPDSYVHNSCFTSTLV